MDQVFMSFLVTKVDAGGLGLNAGNYAELVAAMVFVQFHAQFNLYPRLGPPRGKLSHVSMFRLGLLCCALIACDRRSDAHRSARLPTFSVPARLAHRTIDAARLPRHGRPLRASLRQQHLRLHFCDHSRQRHDAAASPLAQQRSRSIGRFGSSLRRTCHGRTGAPGRIALLTYAALVLLDPLWPR